MREDLDQAIQEFMDATGLSIEDVKDFYYAVEIQLEYWGIQDGLFNCYYKTLYAIEPLANQELSLADYAQVMATVAENAMEYLKRSIQSLTITDINLFPVVLRTVENDEERFVFSEYLSGIKIHHGNYKQTYLS